MMRESFESVMDDITQVSVPLICCEAHRMELLPKLVLDNVVIRYRFEAKNKRRE